MVFSPFTIALGSCGEPQAWDLGTGVVSNGCVDCATDTVGYPLTLYLAYTGAVCAAHATPFGMTLSSCTIGNPYAQAFLVVWVGLLSLSRGCVNSATQGSLCGLCWELGWGVVPHDAAVQSHGDSRARARGTEPLLSVKGASRR